MPTVRSAQVGRFFRCMLLQKLGSVENSWLTAMQNPVRKDISLYTPNNPNFN